MVKRNSNSKVLIGIIVLVSLLLSKDYIVNQFKTWNVKQITFDNKVVTVQVLGMTSNTFTTDPKDLDMFAFKWSSSNEKIATVSNSGIVKTISVGEATITAKSRNGVYDTYTIKVVEHY